MSLCIPPGLQIQNGQKNHRITYSIHGQLNIKLLKLIKTANIQQLNQLKQISQTYLSPLKLAHDNLKEFLTQIDQEFQLQERQSSTGGSTLTRFGNAKSYQHLPVSLIDEKRKNQDPYNEFLPFETQSKKLATEFQIFQSTIHSQWLKLFQLVKTRNYQIIRKLKKESVISHQIRFAQFTTKENIFLVDHSHTVVPQQNKLNQDIVDLHNKRNLFTQQQSRTDNLNQSFANTTLLYLNNGVFGPSKILDIKVLNEVKDKLLIMEKHYITNQNTILERRSQMQQRGRVHLVVLVHGYQGHPFDMILLQNYFCMRFPQHMFMISIQNQNATEGDIFKMGLNLANEITKFILECCPERHLAKISFIGHSLGGLIIRAALPFLNEFSDKMHTFVSLGSPHLGYVHNSHGLIKFGMWILRAFKKSKCLEQLSLNDEKKQEESALFKLAKMPVNKLIINDL